MRMNKGIAKTFSRSPMSRSRSQRKSKKTSLSRHSVNCKKTPVIEVQGANSLAKANAKSPFEFKRKSATVKGQKIKVTPNRSCESERL